MSRLVSGSSFTGKPNSIDETSGRLKTLFINSSFALYRIAKSMTVTDADAQDVVGETYLRAINYYNRTGNHPGIGLLRSIAINTAKELNRKKHQIRRLERLYATKTNANVSSDVLRELKEVEEIIESFNKCTQNMDTCAGVSCPSLSLSETRRKILLAACEIESDADLLLYILGHEKAPPLHFSNIAKRVGLQSCRVADEVRRMRPIIQGRCLFELISRNQHATALALSGQWVSTGLHIAKITSWREPYLQKTIDASEAIAREIPFQVEQFGVAALNRVQEQLEKLVTGGPPHDVMAAYRTAYHDLALAAWLARGLESVTGALRRRQLNDDLKHNRIATDSQKIWKRVEALWDSQKSFAHSSLHPYARQILLFGKSWFPDTGWVAQRVLEWDYILRNDLLSEAEYRAAAIAMRFHSNSLNTREFDEAGFGQLFQTRKTKELISQSINQSWHSMGLDWMKNNVFATVRNLQRLILILRARNIPLRKLDSRNRLVLKLIAQRFRHLVECYEYPCVIKTLEPELRRWCR